MLLKWAMTHKNVNMAQSMNAFEQCAMTHKGVNMAQSMNAFEQSAMTHKSDNMAQSMKDKRGEAMEYDRNAIGVYRTPSESEQKMLVSHVPMEISSLMNNFLKGNDTNKLAAKLSGKRKREVGLVRCSSEIQSSDEGAQIGENTGPAASGSQRKIYTI